ncbi:hypothetical protein WJU16_05305 [Chitinophaga pollutisoli]|uniref:Uncharacterized protein n=1 Tax=Chitinophaga pollutisoli TaxID=3133966 RepID=A0ABZ2YSK2_9BACT
MRALPDHAVIPFVIATGGNAYEPAGFQDATGRMQIFHVPTQDIFFRRIYLPPKPTGLRIFSRTGGSWQPSAYDPAKTAALLLDGITGDSTFMWRVFTARPDAPEQLLRFDFPPADDITVAADDLEAALAAAGAGNVYVVTNGIGKQLAQLAEITDTDKLIFSGKEGEGRTTGDLLRMLAFAMQENGPVKAAIPALAAALRAHSAHRPETVTGGSYPAYLLDEQQVKNIMQHIIPH